MTSSIHSLVPRLPLLSEESLRTIEAIAYTHTYKNPSTLNCENCSIGDSTGYARENHVNIFMCVAYRQEPKLDLKRNIPSIIFLNVVIRQSNLAGLLLHTYLSEYSYINKQRSKCHDVSVLVLTASIIKLEEKCWRKVVLQEKSYVLL